MKKVIFYLVTVFTLLLPVDLLALSGDLSISCNTTSVKPGQSVKCSVSGNSDGQISMVFANISANGSISIDKFRAERIWDVKTEWPNLSLSSNDKKPGVFEIGTVYLKANSAGTGNFVMSGITFTGDSGEAVSVANKSVSISVISDNPTPTPTPEPEPEPAPVVKSSDSSLKSLTVSSSSIDFVSSTLEYNIDVSSNTSTIEIQAVPNDSKATVKLPDNLSLETGLNTFEIVVTAKDGSSTIYKINVNKLENILSDNALLSSLKISGYDINFSSDVFEYKIGDITTNKLDITTVVVDNNSSVKIYGNNNIGKNGVIVIRVTAESGVYKDYVLFVNNVNSSDGENVSTSSFTYIMLIVSSALFVISAIIIVLLLLSRNKYKKKVLAQLDAERDKIKLLEVELQNKLAMIPQVKEEEKVPLEELTKEDVDENFDEDILKKREEEEKNEIEEIDAKEVDDVEEVVEEKTEEEQKDVQDINARDILPPEVSELVNSKSEEVVEKVKEDEPLNVTEISAESVADVVKKKNKEEDIPKEDGKKKKKKKEKYKDKDKDEEKENK
jgi:hypothetical protein